MTENGRENSCIVAFLLLHIKNTCSHTHVACICTCMFLHLAWKLVCIQRHHWFILVMGFIDSLGLTEISHKKTTLSFCRIWVLCTLSPHILEIWAPYSTSKEYQACWWICEWDSGGSCQSHSNCWEQLKEIMGGWADMPRATELLSKFWTDS